jgi:predicted nucleic acid-binding protein
MTGYVVDASIAVKWLVTETYSDKAVRLLDDKITLIAPELLFAEADNALWAMCRRQDISRTDFAEAIDILKSAPITVPTSMRQLAASASRLAVDLDHPVYDCFYLALGVQEHYPIVTADSRFYGMVRAHPYLSDQIIHVQDVK